MTKNKHNFTLNNSSDGVNNNDDPSDHHDYSDDSMPPTPTISTFNKFPRQSSLRFKTPLSNDTPRSSSLGLHQIIITTIIIRNRRSLMKTKLRLIESLVINMIRIKW